MDKSNITVTLSLEEFEKLQNIEKAFDNIIRMIERANHRGRAVMTDELRQLIEEVYL